MSNLSFTNELIFGNGSVTDGVSGIAGTNTSKLLYDSSNKGTNTTVITTSATHNGVVYELDIFAGYEGSVIAVIDEKRFSTQFVFASASATQTATASGFISVSPTVRRLRHLGYV